MGSVTAVMMDVVTEKSGHTMTGMAVSVCLTPAAPSPLPLPYPTVGTSGEGIIDECLRTKISGAKVLTVGGCLKACHGNEAGTLKEVVSLNTAGPCFPALGAPVVLIELGMAGITGSIGQMNKSISVGVGGSASGTGGNASGGGGGGGNAGGPGGSGPQNPSNSGGSGGGNNSGAAPPSPPGPPGAEGQASGGHPVDVITGAMFTIPAADFELFGPIPVQWSRQYRTSAIRRNIGIGWGWSHAYAWRAEITATSIEVIDAEGAAITFPRLGEDEIARAPFGRRLWRRGADLILAFDEEEERTLRRDESGVYRLVEIRDRAGSIVEIFWERGEVCALVDAVGRRAERERYPGGERWDLVLVGEDGKPHRVRAVTYEYDPRGDLVRVIDAGGASTEYHYDEEHFLIAERLPDQLVYHFRYEDGPDGKRRCMETWGELPGRDILAEISGGARTAPPETKGLFHARFQYGPGPFETTMIDAEGGVHRYVGNALGLVRRYTDPVGRVLLFNYDSMGRMVSKQDALGNGFRCTYDAAGRLTDYTDELGQRTALVRDKHGNVTSVVVPGGHRWSMKHDKSGRIIERTDPLGVTTTCAYDAKGRAVGRAGPGGADGMSYDAHGNLVSFTNVLGVTLKYTHDLLGRTVAVAGPEGPRYELTYDSYGNVVEVSGPCGQRMARDHDAAGNVTAERLPGGATTLYHHVGPALVACERPDGSIVRWGYDALLRLLWAENPAGERYTIDYDASGKIIRERTFAGHVYSYEHDEAGRWSKKIWPDGGWARFHRDPAGRVVAVERDNGRTDRYERDDRGFVVRASNPDISVSLSRDGLGRVTREVQSSIGWEFAVDHRAGPNEPREIHRYSTGWSVEIQRGLTQLPMEIALREGDIEPEVITFEHDARGSEIKRSRKGREGGIVTERDALGRPVAVEIKDALGKLLRRRAFRWAATPGLAAIEDSALGERSYELDVLGRPTAARGARVNESFRYSPQGTPLPEGVEARLGPGGRVLQVNDTRCVWDTRGRLQQKIAPDPARSWTYTYEVDDRLVEATRGDGYRVRFLYDPFGRRIAIVGSDGTSTWFGWDASSPVEERASNGRVIRRVFDEDQFTPMLESARTGDWRMVAADSAGAPWFFLGRDESHGELELSTWGRVAHERGETSSLRFAGQRADAETGLVYNRYRYYAPDLGQYTAPDPLLGRGSFQDVGYVHNPTAFIDPMGLVILVGMQRRGVDAEADAAADARRVRTGEDIVYMNDLYNPNTKKGTSLANLPPGESVNIISHGAPGRMRFGRDVVDGAAAAKRLKDGGLQAGTPVNVIACHSATPNAASGESVVNAMHQATGGQNPVSGIAVNPGATNPRAGIAVVRPGVPGTRPHAEGPEGTVDITDGHWARAEGGQPAQPVAPPSSMGSPSGPTPFVPPPGG